MLVFTDDSIGVVSMMEKLMSPTPAGFARNTADGSPAGDFAEWLQSALPGESCEYHRGHLAADRNPITTRLGERARAHVDHTANLALGMEATGRVALVQRRLGDGVFSYLAVKTGTRTRRAVLRPLSA